jgi:hypothetical protein
MCGKLQNNSHKPVTLISENFRASLLDTYQARILIPERLIKDEQFREQLELVINWSWIRARDHTVVILNPSAPIGIGWSTRSKLDQMNEKIGITIALIRAIRRVQLPRKREHHPF